VATERPLFLDNPSKLIAVCNLKVCKANCSSIKVSWQLPDILCPNLKVFSVRVKWSQIDRLDRDEPPVNGYKELHADSAFYVIENLPEKTKFRVSVSCSIEHTCQSQCVLGGCKALKSKMCAEVNAMTWGVAPARDLKYKVKSSNSVLINWTPAKPYGHNKISMQVLCCQLASYNDVDVYCDYDWDCARRIDVGVNARSFELCDLNRDTEYIVWLEAESGCRLALSEQLVIVVPSKDKNVARN
jgi:hypothetical protein